MPGRPSAPGSLGLAAGFGRDFDTYAEEIVVPGADLAVVPDRLVLSPSRRCHSTGRQRRRSSNCSATPPRPLLVTGAADAVWGYVAALTQDRGWQVTGLARAEDETFVRGVGVDFTTHAEVGRDALADVAVLQERVLALTRAAGTFVGVQPNAKRPTERGITAEPVAAHAGASRLSELLVGTVSGQLPARGQEVGPLDQVANPYVLEPWPARRCGRGTQLADEPDRTILPAFGAPALPRVRR